MPIHHSSAVSRALMFMALGAALAVAQNGSLHAQSTLADSVARYELLRRTPPARIATASEALERADLGFALLRAGYVADGPTTTPARRLDELQAVVRRTERLSPGSPRVQLHRALLLLHSSTALTRHASRAAFRAALDQATAAHDTSVMVAAHVELGYAHWRSHDALVDRRIEVVPGSAIRSIKSAMQPVLSNEGEVQQQLSFHDIRQNFENATQPLPRTVTGDSDYRTAEQHFRDATSLAPMSCAAFRGLAMVLVARDRWMELRESAQRAAPACGPSAWAGLATGLALARLGQAREALAAYDAMLDALPTAERAWLDDIARVLPPSDSVRLTGSDASARRQFEGLYWMMADPAWSSSDNESRIEFLSRLAYAELRWSLPERGIRGADTDRGRTYVRYGPPGIVAVFAPGNPSSPWSQGYIYLGETTSVWAYDSGLLFSFALSPAFGTARRAFDDDFMVRRFADAQPVRWDNIAGFTVDSLPVSLLRFRSAADSLALLVAAPARLASSPPPALVAGRLWLLAQDARIIGQDSVLTPTGGTLQWTVISPFAPLVVRVEATGPDPAHLARSVQLLDPTGSTDGVLLPLRGPALSDLVLAHADGRGRIAATRWSDHPPRVLTSGVPTGSTVRLMWESYELTAREGRQHTETTIELQRERAAVQRIAITILGALADVVSRSETADRVTLRFRQESPSTPVLLTDLDLQLGETAPGSYRVVVTVRDLHSGTQWTRAQALRVVARD